MDLDFSELLDDPDFAGTFDVIRRVETISPLTGRSSTAETTESDIDGVVTPGDAGDLLRKDDSQMTSRIITVTTKYRLRASGDGFQPDIVLYDGIRFTVRAAKAWHKLGDGFIRAACVSERAADPAPV